MSDSPSTRRWWTQEEDRLLQQEVRAQLDVGGDQGAMKWSVIADSLPGRSNKDCRKRWTKISSSSRKGTWSTAEDHLLRKGVAMFSFQWTRVAEIVVTRQPDQCAKRWHHSLDPNVKRTPWSNEEDSILIGAVQNIGRDWKDVGRQYFPSRSTTDIKNRYVILSRRHALPASGQHADDGLAEVHINPIDILTPDIDLSFVATPYYSGANNISTPPLNVPLVTDLPPSISNSPSTLSLPDIPDSNIVFGNQGWPVFDERLGGLNCVSPGMSTSSDEGYHTSLPNGSLPETPSTTDTRRSASSTLVLEELQPETVGLVIDTLLKAKSTFKMQLINSGS
ncbi:SANT/Myb-like DNA-binding domain-containing protein [Aspergillus puulaauensis]|uniref:Homeodomain-like protein n=1 Tax=Aspergillus puulaauensis TaxID=1220207 RepID=A0A7R7XSA1_9EURO|nr:uncharacterized protein APUU_51506A [Aspergillus puulaauensis]BCS26795.1 hypothetical protein APUU_51506A [Aspergillus puulaauensis]